MIRRGSSVGQREGSFDSLSDRTCGYSISECQRTVENERPRANQSLVFGRFCNKVIVEGRLRLLRHVQSAWRDGFRVGIEVEGTFRHSGVEHRSEHPLGAVLLLRPEIL